VKDGFARATLGWAPPDPLTRVQGIDAHTEGEPLRVIVGGFPIPPGDTILERRRHAREHLDHLRTALMWEPRGHADMYGCLVMPPATGDGDFGVLFLHNEGYSTMCGHGIIAVTKVVLETGLFPITAPVTTLRIDSPAGRITAFANVEEGRVRSVRFRNVPSYVEALDRSVDVPGFGPVRYDLAFGGAFYAYVDARPLGLDLRPAAFRDLIGAGMAIKRAVMADRPIEHPVDADLGFLSGTIFVGPALDGGHSRNVCIFADGEVDRSPTGTGVSGRLALHHARGEIAIGQPIVIESLIGGRFTGTVAEATTWAGRPAIVPDVEGRAFITGRTEFCIDPEDPLAEGFILR
jgi:trans-L-3-hydroxyproline dehydratase